MSTTPQAVGPLREGQGGPLGVWRISGRPLVHRDARYTCQVCRGPSFEPNRPHMHCETEETA